MRTNLKKYTIDYCDVMNYIVYIFFFFFFNSLFTSQYTSRSSSVVCIFFGLLWHILCRGLPNALFSVLLPGLEPRQWQCQHGVPTKNDVGHPDPPKYPKYLSHLHPLLCYLSPWIYNDRFPPGSHTYERGIYIDLQELSNYPKTSGYCITLTLTKPIQWVS